MNNIAEENFDDIEEEGQELNVRQQDREEQHKIKSKFSYLCRPPVDPLVFNESTPLTFMQTDVDYYFAKPNNDLSQTAIIRLFGVTDTQNSVMVHVHNFTSYFWVECPPELDPTPENLDQLKSALNNRCQTVTNINNKFALTKIECHMKESIRGFKKVGNSKLPHLKIFTRRPNYVGSLRRVFEKGISIGNIQFNTQTFESNMPFALRFMIDTQMRGMSWVKINSGDFTIRTDDQKTSTSQIEIDTTYDKLIQIPLEGEGSKLAPLRILSFDIECSSNQGFPQAEKHPVIQIANVCKIHTQEEPFVKNIFTLNTCSNIVGAEVRSHEKEDQLLKDWEEFMIAVDPDIITGYNIISFDLPYILDRAKALNITGFGKFGRVINNLSKVKTAVYQSKLMGMRETKDINIDGRIQLDMLVIMHVEHKLSSYSLNNVSYTFLKEQKEDVHPSIIYDLQNGNSDTRRRLAVYCIKDAELPLKLMDKLMSLYNHAEMARVTGVPLRLLIIKGQQIKVTSQLYRKAMTQDMIIPVEPRTKSDGKFEGADVLDPMTGFYQKPIVTLDFASLYPSIMMAHNLCFSTLVRKNVAEKLLTEDQYIKTPHGDYFVKPHVKKGLLPEILEELLAARKKAKDELKNEKDPFKRAVLDGRQLALKISANSVYGFTGAQNGALPCLEISSSVTSFGRTMIHKTKDLVESHYSKANGYENDAKVVYGDTDSVMILFGVESMEKAMEFGREASKFITEQFIKPIKLEFEKVYYPFLLINKKRYCGLYWTKLDTWDKLDKKGIESVRRDNCMLVRSLVDTVLTKILIDRNVPGAVDYVKETVSDLLQNKIDLSHLVITKAISKKIEKQEEPEDENNNNKAKAKSKGKENEKKSANTYKSKSAHVELAQKMQNREGGSAPSIGDRIAYVMVKGARGTKNYENSEDPIYVLENDLPIDFDYYLEKQIKKPILRIFEAILPNPESLFIGKHTTHIYVPKVNQNRGLGGFVKIKMQCLACKCPVDGDGAICANCDKQGKRMDVHLRKLFVLRDLQSSFSELWTQCQRCQGSLHQDVLCTNRDCPIFYKRKKVQKDITEAQTTIDRFDNDW